MKEEETVIEIVIEIVIGIVIETGMIVRREEAVVNATVTEIVIVIVIVIEIVREIVTEIEIETGNVEVVSTEVTGIAIETGIAKEAVTAIVNGLMMKDATETGIGRNMILTRRKHHVMMTYMKDIKEIGKILWMKRVIIMKMIMEMGKWKFDAAPLKSWSPGEYESYHD